MWDVLLSLYSRSINVCNMIIPKLDEVASHLSPCMGPLIDSHLITLLTVFSYNGIWSVRLKFCWMQS